MRRVLQEKAVAVGIHGDAGIGLETTVGEVTRGVSWTDRFEAWCDLQNVAWEEDMAMRYVVVILSIVLLAWAPSAVFAQGFMGPGCGIPSCAPAKKALSPALYIGYAGTSQQGRGLTLGFEPSGGNAAFWNYRWDIGYYGLQLGAELPFQPNNAVTVAVSGSWLVPFYGHAVEQRNWGGVNQIQTREWGAKPQWYFLNATGEYKLNEGLAILGGLLYDNTDVSINNPDVLLGLGWRADDSANVKLSTYIPYVGISSSLGGFSAGFVTFPYVFGTVKVSYNEQFNSGGLQAALWETSGSYNGGYFLQTWLEYNTTREGANFGVYAAYNLLHATATQSLDINWDATGLSHDYRVNVDRQIWMLGAKFSVAFSLPLLRQ